MTVKKNFNEKYYRVQLFLGYDENGVRKYKNFYGTGKKDAELKRDEYKRLLSSGLSDKNPTLTNSLHEWLFEVIKPSGIKDSTFARYYDHYNAIKSTSMAFMKVADIQAMTIQKILNEMAEKNSYNFVLLIRKFLNRHFTYLVGTNMIMRNPMQGVQLPQKARETRTVSDFTYDPYTKAEKQLILLYMEQNHPVYWVVTSLLFKIGAREGEILGLRENDLLEDSIRIDSSLAWVKVIKPDGTYHYEYQNDSTKNKSSEREVFIDNEVHDLLKKARTLKNISKLKMGAAFTNSDLVFVNPTGSPIDANSYRKYLKKVQKELGLKIKTVHCIRHTFVTEMYEKGVDEMTVQEIIGHTKGSNITRDVYTHLRQENKKERMLKAIR